MRYITARVAITVCLASTAATAQTVPVSVAQAEAEAVSFPRPAAASVVQPALVSSPFAGTGDRRCVPSTTADVHASGSLRSGDMIVRGVWGLPLQAGKEHKLLWIPLHGSRELVPPLTLRADRIDQPADSLRLTVAQAVHGGGRPGMYGYPSLVSFPSSGRWLVVATAGADWGCFVLDVSVPAPSPASSSTSLPLPPGS